MNIPLYKMIKIYINLTVNKASYSFPAPFLRLVVFASYSTIRIHLRIIMQYAINSRHINFSSLKRCIFLINLHKMSTKFD